MSLPQPGTLLALAVLLCQIVAGLIYSLGRSSIPLPPEWDPQFLALLGLSTLLLLSSLLLVRPLAKRVSAILALGAYLLATYPLPAGSELRLCLGIPLAMASAAAFGLPDSLGVGALFLLISLLLEGPATVFGLRREAASPAEALLLASVLGLAFGAGMVLRALGEARRRAVLETRRLQAAIDRIAEVNAGFQSALATAEEDSILQERNRITREIHDIVGYAFTNQQMMLEAALVLAEPANTRLVELLSMAKEGVSEGLRETRKTLYELRRIDEPRNPGLGVFLRVARNFETVTGVRVRLDFGNARGELEQETWMTVYRLIQESMINAFRHGKAGAISITFREDPERLHVAVRDDGRGSAALAEGIGLSGMRERIAALGGELRAGNSEDGFLVSASLPRRARRAKP